MQILVDFDLGEKLQHGEPKLKAATDPTARHARALFAQAGRGEDQPQELAYAQEDEFDERVEEVVHLLAPWPHRVEYAKLEYLIGHG